MRVIHFNNGQRHHLEKVSVVLFVRKHQLMSVAPPTDLGEVRGDRLLADLHVRFVAALNDRKDSFHYWTSQHLRVSGMYWGCSALFLLNQSAAVFVAEDIIAFTLGCQNSDGGFGGNHGQASHMLYTLSALQVLALYRGLDKCRRDDAVAWIAARQKSNGSFEGDEWGEVDTRFPYIAMNALQILGRLDAVDLDKAVEWILLCQNWDGGFGVSPGAESHAGQIFCCVAALCIANSLHRIDVDKLANWLAFRQLPSGGLNGRPEKKADVCYSWWVMSSLSTLQRLDWIHKDALFEYIFACQDAEDGGIADKPGNMPDVYHTFFGLCGLSLLGYQPRDATIELQQINPVYALPYHVLEDLGVTVERGLNVGRRIASS
jgi:geranylgeranyl transferase type-2 subunit beta